MSERVTGMMAPPPYIGRFAPSPTGPLHMGSLVAALASWCDARAHSGQWLLRIEDVDTPRCDSTVAQQQIADLGKLGLIADQPVLWQSQRSAAYQTALDGLIARGAAYPCACTRKEIADSLLNATHQRHQTLAYAGTCRPERGGLQGRPARAWRLRVPDAGHDTLTFTDRLQGVYAQALASEVGDFVLKRADGLWAYQLAVVVDDATQGITHVVRGADLLDSTPRQIYLQQQLGVATPRYWHVPVVNAADGNKLSKQNGAAALDLRDTTRCINALHQAGQHLGLWQEGGGDTAQAPAATRAEQLERAVRAWQAKLTGLAHT